MTMSVPWAFQDSRYKFSILTVWYKIIIKPTFFHFTNLYSFLILVFSLFLLLFQFGLYLTCTREVNIQSLTVSITGMKRRISKHIHTVRHLLTSHLQNSQEPWHACVEPCPQTLGWRRGWRTAAAMAGSVLDYTCPQHSPIVGQSVTTTTSLSSLTITHKDWIHSGPPTRWDWAR